MRATTNVASRRRHKRVIKAAKGYRAIGKRFKTAKQAVMKAGINAYRGRKEKKRNMRRLWITRISNALRPYGISYSVFMDHVHKANITLNRKMISEIAIQDPAGFDAILSSAGLSADKKTAPTKEAKETPKKEAPKKEEEAEEEAPAEETSPEETSEEIEA